MSDYWLMIRQDEGGDVYGAPAAVPVAKAPTPADAIRRQYGEKHAPSDRRLHRMLIFRVTGGVAVPVKIHAPDWRPERDWTPLLGGPHVD